MGSSHLRMIVVGVLLSLAVIVGFRPRHSPKARGVCTWNSRVVNESIASGDAIVHALEQWHASEGRFPEVLSDLVPAYLPSLPLPTAGTREWRYICVDGGAEYGLSFGCVLLDGLLSLPADDSVSFYPSATTGSKPLGTSKWYINE